MKLAIVSDIHGNLPALEAVIADIAREGVDAVLNLGDILSGPMQPEATAQRLMALGWPTIAGNHERQLLAARRGGKPDPLNSDGFAAAEVSNATCAWLEALPPTLLWGGEVWATHGRPGDDLQYGLETPIAGWSADGSPGLRPATEAELRARWLGPSGPPPGATLALCGHSHVPRVMQLDGLTLLNPGSVGLPGFDDDHVQRHVVENHAPHARYALATRTATGWRCALVAVPYGAAPQAALARRRGFPDWARALETGRALTPWS